jgi:hypothetical protein
VEVTENPFPDGGDGVERTTPSCAIVSASPGVSDHDRRLVVRCANLTVP